MTRFLGRPSVSGVRWIGRIIGTLLGLLLLSQFGGLLTGPSRPSTTRGYLLVAGFILVISGFAVAWFKDLAAFFLILGGSTLISVISLLTPGAEWPTKIFIGTGLLSFLFLYAHIAAKKKK